MNSHMISRCLVLTGFTLAAASLALGATYYVDSSGGNDGNNGTSQSTPWQSLGKVNGTTFSPGDQILFKSGDVWTGALSPKGSGSAGNPITIGNYGSGALPLIQGNGVSATVSISGQQYWDVTNLEITDQAGSAGNRRGIGISSSDHIHIMNCTIGPVTGMVGQDLTSKTTGGIYANTAATDLVINGCLIHDCSNQGIALNGGPFSNLLISNNTIYNITKNAMIIRFCDSTDVVEYNVVHDTATALSGNSIYNTSSSGGIFRHNEGYRNVTPIVQDGDMYDADLGSTNTIWEYSYSHDNNFGLMMYDTGGSGGIIVRYNISQNDKGGGRGIIYFNYPLSSTSVYNNVIYVAAGMNSNILLTNAANHHTLSFENNIIYNNSTASKYSINAGDATTFSHNLFFGQHPASEPADPFKLTSDPMFVSPGSGGLGINSVTGYQLKAGSPAIGSGILIANNGGQDYWGNPVSATAAPNRGAYNGTGAGGGQVSAPVFSPGPGAYSGGTSVTITSATSGASIRYTTDGSTTPSETVGTLYSGPVSINSTTTLQAIAYESGMTDSPVTSGTYTIGAPPPPPAAPSFSPAPGSYSSAQSVTISDTTAGASIFYTTNGSTPTTSSTMYTGPVAITTTTTLKAIASNSGGNSSETDGTYTITSPPPKITLQASKLAPTGSGQAISTATDAAAPGGTWVKIASTAVGQWIQFTTPSIPAGTYSLSFIYRTNTTRAQHNVTIDGTQVGTTIVDQYAPGATATYPPAVTIGSVTFGTAGTHTIRLTATGKNAASTSYQISAVQFIFQ
jgi:Chitobiase/beta-hexosaminidase C-terminal domain/Right handed beta helix region/DUF5010 C-terminal domain